MSKSPAQIKREIAAVLGKRSKRFAPGDPNNDDYLRHLDDVNDPPRTALYRAAKAERSHATMKTTRAPAIYMSSYCNRGHRMKDGKPVDHECKILPVAALEAERAGHIDEAIAIMGNAAPLRTHRGVKSEKRAHSTMKTGAANKPHVLKISRPKTFAGQRSITATVQYPGESPASVEFVGPSTGGAGPVVMVTKGGQTFVTNPSRFGGFGSDWVRRFFE